MSLCKDCIKGEQTYFMTMRGRLSLTESHVRRFWTLPAGEIEFIGGVRCYVGTPSEEYAKDKAILFLSDVFGIDLINAQVRTSFAALISVKV
ncbi:hypothetical protein ID866_10335 [Astraeus odoratus]|nr:hypothetical protein ID866_10335 [Astraeus odoratus]